MTNTFGVRESAVGAWQRLQLALLDIHQPVPCQSAPEVWTSDDPEQRAIASRVCSDCAVMVLCDQFARINRETANVWAGIDRTPKRGRPANQPKERTA